MIEFILMYEAGWFDWLPKLIRWLVVLVIVVALGGLYLILKG